MENGFVVSLRHQFERLVPFEDKTQFTIFEDFYLNFSLDASKNQFCRIFMIFFGMKLLLDSATVATLYKSLGFEAQNCFT